MKKVNPQDQARQKKAIWAGGILLLCLIFFMGGLSVPYLLRHNRAGSTEVDKLQTVVEILKSGWFYGRNQENLDTDLVEKAITGMTIFEEDPFTNYFSLEQAQALSESLAGSSVGIGISYYPDEDQNMVIRQVFTNSTADQAGLEKGDTIIQVGDLKASQNTTEDLVGYIKSHEGQEIELQILRDGESQSVKVTPGTYDTTVSVYLDPNGQYGEVILNSFSENSGQEFIEAVHRLEDAGIQNLILDLRGNTGGYISAAQEIASALLPEDSVVFIEDFGQGVTKELMTKEDVVPASFEKIIVLQNGDTASAAEVLIGALKDNLPQGKVVTAGSTSYGKGTEQRIYPFQDGTSLKYTIAQWLTPNGTSINLTGFAPDYPVAVREIHSVPYRLMEEGEVIEPDTVAPNAQAIQVFLDSLGYPVDRKDTYFSLASSEGLKAFQADEDLPVTGVADWETFDRLLDQVILELNRQADELDDTRAKAIELVGVNEGHPQPDRP